jgi:hypothetical protein
MGLCLLYFMKTRESVRTFKEDTQIHTKRLGCSDRPNLLLKNFLQGQKEEAPRCGKEESLVFDVNSYMHCGRKHSVHINV